jgi:outer membrane receptor protein involved in Fe transport
VVHARRVTLAALLALCAAGSARADGTADEADLQFRLGTEEFQRGRYEAALEHFFVSNRVAPNRNVLFNIGSAFERLRRYADAHRYYADALDGETDLAAIRADTAALARITPKVAVLEVITAPPGATLYLDRKSLGSVGRAPRPLALAPGRYKVIAELEGYETAEAGAVEAVLGASTPVTLALRRIVGTVHVAVSGAPSAAVRVDDERAPPACTAPCDLQLPPGQHQLFFAAEGFRAAPRVVTVRTESPTTATAMFAPLTGSILVEAEEPGALIAVDGRPAGFTPGVIQNVPVGRRKLRVSLRGRVPVDLEVEVQPDQQAQPPLVPLVPVREVVAVSRYSEDLDEAPSSVTVIGGGELRAFGYPTIAEALRGVRGFTISNDRAYPSAAVRGLGQPDDYGNRLLVLSDGVPLNDDIANASAIGSNARVDLHDVERIEVVRGPGSLLYGTGALSGVVNLVTRARDEPDSVHAGFGVYDGVALHGRAGFHKSFGADQGLWASVSTARSDGFDSTIPLPEGPRVASGVEAFSSVNTAGRAWAGPLTAQWFFQRRNQSVPVGGYQAAFNDPGTRLLDTRAMAELRYEPKLSSSLQLLLRAHGNRSGSQEWFASAPPAYETYIGVWYGAEARLIWSLPALRLTLGGEGQVHPVVSLRGLTTAGAGAGSYLDEHAPYQFSAGYFLLDATPAPWLKLSGGARVDVYSTFGAIVVPRGAAIFRLAPGSTLKLMGGRAFRAPSIYEQTYNDAGVSQARAVDPLRDLTLAPESIWSGEVEYAHRFRTDWVALLGGYLSRVEQIIGAGPDAPGSDVLRYQNSSTPVLLAGADVELRREFRRQWMLTASYGFQRARYLGSPLDDKALANAPEHLLSFKGIAPLLPDLALLALRVTLDAPRRIRLEASDTTGTSLIVDATISGTLKGLHYTAGVYNLADQRAQVPVSRTFASRTIPQNGRTLLFDLTGTFP